VNKKLTELALFWVWTRVEMRKANEIMDIENTKKTRNTILNKFEAWKSLTRREYSRRCQTGR